MTHVRKRRWRPSSTTHSSALRSCWRSCSNPSGAPCGRYWASEMGEAEHHLSKVCKRFARVVVNHEPYPTKFERTKDPYRVLVRAVVYQQLSGKAAGTIHGRV